MGAWGEFLCVHNEKSWGNDSSLKMKFIYVAYAPHTHRLETITCDIFSMLCLVRDLSCEVKYKIFHFCQPAGAQRVLHLGAFCIHDFG